MTDVPDADRFEQNIPANPDEEDSRDQDILKTPDDANEADVVEQSIPVPMDEDYR